jgi:hypothetical protein
MSEFQPREIAMTSRLAAKLATPSLEVRLAMMQGPPKQTVTDEIA